VKPDLTCALAGHAPKPGVGLCGFDSRTASTSSALDVPTLATALETHLEATAASVTPGTVAGNRRMAERTWLPALGDLPVDAITRDAVVKWVTTQRATETQRSASARAKAIAAQRKDPSGVVPEPRTSS
jgi:integrase